MEASFALQKDPLQALFNYLLEAVLNRLCLCCLQRFGEAAWKKAEGKGNEPDWGRCLGSYSSIWGLGTGGIPAPPLEGSTSPSEACLGPTLCPFFGLYAGILIGSDGRSAETEAISEISKLLHCPATSHPDCFPRTHSLSSSSKLKNQARSKVSDPSVAAAISPRDQGSIFLRSARDTEGNVLSPKEIRSCQGIVAYLFFK